MAPLSQESLVKCVQMGIITEAQMQKILQVEKKNPSAIGEKERGLNTVMVFYYFGAMIIISAFTYFLVSQWDHLSSGTVLAISLVFQLVCYVLGFYLRNKLKYLISGGLLITAAISITPLVIYSVERMFGVWPAEPKGASYNDFWLLIKPCWVYIELGTLIVALLTLLRCRFSLIALVIGHTLWFFSMDVVEIILGGTNYSPQSWETRKWVSIIISAAMIGVARLLNRRTKEDYSMWLFIYGGAIFMTAGALIFLNKEFGAFLYFIIHLIFIVASIRWQRRSLMVFGALGAYAYLGHLAYEVFKNSPFFPIALAFIGILMILGTVAFQRNKAALVAFIAPK